MKNPKIPSRITFDERSAELQSRVAMINLHGRQGDVFVGLFRRKFCQIAASMFGKRPTMMPRLTERGFLMRDVFSMLLGEGRFGFRSIRFKAAVSEKEHGPWIPSINRGGGGTRKHTGCTRYGQSTLVPVMRVFHPCETRLVIGIPPLPSQIYAQESR